MIPYILHVTVITTVCFLFYKLLLQKETFYRLNRWTLLSCLAVAFTLPLLPAPREWSLRDTLAEMADRPVAPPAVERKEPVRAVAATNETEVSKPAAPVVRSTAVGAPEKRSAKKRQSAGLQGSTNHKEEIVNQPMAAAGTPAVQPVVESKPGITATMEGVKPAMAEAGKGIAMALKGLFYCYLFGVLLFGVNFLLQMAVLLYQSYCRPVIRDGRFRIVEVSGNRAPCSFGNTIFINPGNYDWETFNQILIHEKVHVSGRHTVDILLAEIALVLQWFNPFAWLYRREVENNLEFLTDASVLEHREVERSAYQLSLLRVSAPHLPFSITNNYNQSLLKRRIVMMNSKRSSGHTVWKYFFLIPLLTGLVCALNKPAAYGAAIKDPSVADGNRPAGDKTLPVSRVNPSPLWVMGTAMMTADTGRKPKTAEDTLRWKARQDAEQAGRKDDEGSITVNADEMAQAAYNLSLATTVTVDPHVNVNLEDVTARAMNIAKANADVRNIAVSVPTVNVNAMPYAAIEDYRNENDTDVLDGSWFATSSSGDGKINFDFKRQSGFSTWNNSFSVDKSEFNPFPGAGTVEFKLTREAGTINFKGQFDGEEGFGHFHFAPNEAYFTALKNMGIDNIDGRRFTFFNANVKKEYAAEMMHTFPHLSTHELISLSATHVDAEFIKYWQGSGLDDLDNPRAFITLKSLHIDKAYVDELKAAGYDHLSLRDLTSMKSMHIDGAYVKEIRAAGYDHVEPRELISLKSQHVDGAYIRSLGAGKDNQAIPLREIISYKSMHIDSNYIASLRAAGYPGLSRNDLTSLYSMRVTADYIKSFQAAGYKDLTPRELISLKSMNITPEYAKSFEAAGYKDLDIRQLHAFKSQGITPEFIKGWRDLGYDHISANQLSSLKAMGITPDFVREFNKIGFTDIPVNMLNTLKATGVNAEYVSKMKEKGFVSKDLGKYIRLKNDFN